MSGMTMSADQRADMTPLVARLTTGPVLSSPDDARRSFDHWLADLPEEPRQSLGAVVERFPLARTLLEGLVEASPYLFELVRTDAVRLVRLLRSDPERHLADLLASIDNTAATAADEAELMRLLRHIKAEAALLIAICDIGGVWPVMRVTAALSAIAFAATQSAVRFLLLQETARGRLTPADPVRPEIGSGLIVLAMGKMGAAELNYSSDIDLIVYFDRDAAPLQADIEPQPFFARVAQGLSRLLQQRTSDGYVFRVDLRLRPDPASTPVAVSTEFALGYYEREGRTWERAAMIKAKPCAGDIAAGEALLAEISPFIWRRHLDFAALADIHEMKRQMHAFRGHNEIAVEGHNIKQGRGGIREIEFFVQTQQLIAGGRHPQLRVRQTLEALDVLAANNWITYEVRDQLAEAYRYLRRLEHRLQMVADEQTHTLPDTPEALQHFARFFGYADRDAFAHDLLHHLQTVQGHYIHLFEGNDPAGTAALPAPDYARGRDDARMVDWLAGRGFKQPAAAAETLKLWTSGAYRSLRNGATQRNLFELIPALVATLGRSENPDSALVHFDRFLQSLQRGSRLISLLHQNSDLLSLLALILSTAPRLGDMIVRQPQIVDGLVDQRFFGAMPQPDDIERRLQVIAADSGSYEEFLDQVRLFGQEGLFLIGTRILSGTIGAQLAGTAFADIADGIVRAIHALVLDQFKQQYGEIAGQRTAILAMGRLGSREMTASSDLDLILIYDYDDERPDSDGPRSLHGAQYFARLTQRLIGAFTTRTNYGVLYDIDMRLRPSGRSGPVATRLDAFAQYQEADAWTWEHMALTRGRVIAGQTDVAGDIEGLIRGVLTRAREPSLIANDVLEMRKAIAQEKGEGEIWDLRNAAGGMIDIEFIAQYLQLVHAAGQPGILDPSTQHVLEKAARLELLAQSDADLLRGAMRLYQDLNQILRLCLNESFRPETSGADLLRLLARAGDEPDFSALQARLQDTQTEVRKTFERLMADWTQPTNGR
jgi:glutamate-ammonia-ligase adenylyltransferase